MVTTLVLDSAYQPLSKIPWQTAMSLLTTGRVEVVEEYKDKFVRTVSKIFNMPAVVRFIKSVFKRWNNRLNFSKMNVYIRDHGECQYCGKKLTLKQSTMEHVLPVSRGGKTTWENIVVACHFCNQRKADKNLKQANMTLRNVPYCPKSIGERELLHILNGDVPQEWKIWLSL